MEQETKEQSASQNDIAVVTPAQEGVVGAPPTSEVPCPTCAGALASMPVSYVYAVGGIKAILAGGGMTLIEVGNGLLNISTPDETWGQPVGAAAPGFVMKIYVANVDEHFARAKAQGATIISEPVRTENSVFGMRSPLSLSDDELPIIGASIFRGAGEFLSND